jgi:hypothetical protein
VAIGVEESPLEVLDGSFVVTCFEGKIGQAKSDRDGEISIQKGQTLRQRTQREVVAFASSIRTRLGPVVRGILELVVLKQIFLRLVGQAPSLGEARCYFGPFAGHPITVHSVDETAEFVPLSHRKQQRSVCKRRCLDEFAAHGARATGVMQRSRLDVRGIRAFENSFTTRDRLLDQHLSIAT